MSRRIARAALIAYALGTAIGFLWAAATSGPLAARSDFVAFYTAGRLLLHGRSGQLYNLATQATEQRPLLASYDVAPRPGVEALPFHMPPFAALAFAPLAALPLPLAYALFNALSAAVLALALWRLLRRLGWPRAEAALGVGLGLAYFPVLGSLALGQVSPLLTALLALAALDLLGQRPGRAGVWLALSLFKPQYAALPLLVFVLARQWRLMAGFAVAATALGLLSVAVAGPDGARSYAAHLLSISAPGGDPTVAPAFMHNWRGLATRLVPPGQEYLVWPLALLADALTTGALLWLWRGGWPPDQRARLLRLSGLALAALLVSPHAHVQDVALLLLPACWLATLNRERQMAPLPTTAALAIGHLAGLIGGAAGLLWYADLNVLLCAAGLALLLTTRPGAPSWPALLRPTPLALRASRDGGPSGAPPIAVLPLHPAPRSRR